MQISNSSISRPTLSASFGRASRIGAQRSASGATSDGTLSNAELKQIIADMLG